MAMQRPPRDFENVEFEVIAENWNRYELHGNIVARAKIVVTRVARDLHSTDPNKFSLASQNIFVVDAPTEQRGEPTPLLTPQELANPQGTITNVLTSNEVWNRYRILSTGTVLKVKLVLDDAVRLLNKFDNDGMPQYVFRTTTMVLPDRTANTNVRI